ncbi:hypothetical protein EV383_6183 [Pseudonocardia sediminis]|uniref:Probable membrane transporter protein n=1 Tax=Pseudonocardia sediminis TaxID=1397368 RepID=A0A4Q7UA27_PSEST|nr:sulfite exporter TauE/SafE family protein [Pseudonocardia sediminis]RZT75443.1 hypothetical protein EV383_6183 [Pseudonocardia sediminis]
MSIALAAALGLVIGLVIGALGGGGGVLAVPALVYALGQDAQSATTSSIIIVGIISVVGVLARLRDRTIDWRTGIAFGVVGIAAAWAGTLLNRAAPQNTLLLAFSAITLLVAVAMLINSRPSRQPAPDAASDESVGTAAADSAGGATTLLSAPAGTSRVALVQLAAKVIACGAVVGFLTGFLGVGGGFLVVPALVIVLRIPMTVAIGTSLLIIAFNSVSSLASRVGDLHLDLRIIVPFTIAAIVGTLLGKKVTDRFSGAALSRAFAVMLVLVGLFVAAESSGIF